MLSLLTGDGELLDADLLREPERLDLRSEIFGERLFFGDNSADLYRIFSINFNHFLTFKIKATVMGNLLGSRARTTSALSISRS